MTEKLTLAAGFPAVTRQDWRDGVEAALRGKPADSLSVSLPEGIEVAALLTPEDGIAPTAVARTGEGPWGIRVVAMHPDVKVANETLLDDLERGASQVHVRLDRGTRAGDGDGRGIDGVAVHDADGLGVLLSGVLVDLAPVSLDAGASFLAAGRALLSVAGSPVAGLFLGADPLGSLAATGSLPQGMEQALTDVAVLAGEALKQGEAVRAVAVDTSPHHDAGATEELDLAIALATAVAYLRAMVDGGLSVEVAADQIEFRVPVGVDQFVGIAKLRALRQLWAHVLRSCGVDDPAPALVHATLGASSLTRRDPWSNLLRGTIACFAAGVGGADSVTIPPFDSALGLSGELGRRIARNTQLVLQREGHVGRVADPAAGSFHVEALTADLAASAWSTFQKIEHEGGMVAALVDGHVHQGIARRVTERDQQVATRRRPVTGVSEFPLLDERLPAVERAEEVASDHLAASTFLPRQGPWTHVEPLEPAAVAGPFEALRDRAEAEGSRPRVLSVNLGPLARHTARATFAANLFAAGGIEAIDVDVPDDGDIDEANLTSALADTGTTLAVVCGDDAQYADVADAVVAALKAAGATVFVAGRPIEGIDPDGWVHLGCDVVAMLDQALQAVAPDAR